MNWISLAHQGPVMRYARALEILTLVTFITVNGANAAEANALWSTGVYKLVGTKERTGTLTIHMSTPAEVRFSMDVVVCMNYCGTTSAVNHIGEVINSAISVSGTSGRFVELEPETDPPTPELITCELVFSKTRSNLIVVTQKMDCWQFGQGVNVSGTYRLIKGSSGVRAQ